MRKNCIKRSVFFVLVIVCILGISISKPAKAEEYSNVTMGNAAPITIGETVSVTFHKGVKEFLYYKLTIPKNIGNQWVNFTISNYASNKVNMYLCDKQDKTLGYKRWLYANSSSTLRTRIEGAASCTSTIALTPGSTYYIELEKGTSNTYGDCVISVNSVSDDNWGTFDKADKITVNKRKTGKIEYSEDIDCFYITLPKDKKKHTFVISSDHSIYALFADSNTVKIDDTTVSANATNNSFSAIGKGQKIYIRIQRGSSSVDTANYAIKVVSQKKTISKLKLTKYKKGSRKIVGKTIKNATVKLTVNKKTYTVQSSKNGAFTVKLKKKLKYKNKIKVSVSKLNYKKKSIIYKVK